MLTREDLDAFDLPSLALSQRETVEWQTGCAEYAAGLILPPGFTGTRDARAHLIARADDLARTGRLLSLLARHEQKSLAFVDALIGAEATRTAKPERGVLLDRLATSVLPWLFADSFTIPARAAEVVR